MKIKFILPALEESKSPFWRPIKYSLFPPLGLATLASLCDPDDELEIVDEHVEEILLDDEPDLVCIESYITNAFRAYQIADHYRAKKVTVAIGGLHATSLPNEAAHHADVVFSGLGESSFVRFLKDFRAGKPANFYEQGQVNFDPFPLPRRDLIKRDKYLVPNSMVFSRGCPNHCAFCYVNSFYKNGKSFYTYQIDRILAEIESLPGPHLYFLDDNLFAHKKLAREIFRGMRGMNKFFQGAITVQSVLDDSLIEEAYQAGFRSAFIGFESINQENINLAHKRSNLVEHYQQAIQRLDQLGIMINGSFIFGLDHDTPDVFERTTDWAIRSGITTATNHILTPYPGTELFQSYQAAGRIRTKDWRLYDTRHLVFSHPKISKQEMEAGYKKAYTDFYRWKNILHASQQHETLRMKLKHFTYAGAWKKFEAVWNFIIKTKQLSKTRIALIETLK